MNHVDEYTLGNWRWIPESWGDGEVSEQEEAALIRRSEEWLNDNAPEGITFEVNSPGEYWAPGVYQQSERSGNWTMISRNVPEIIDELINQAWVAALESLGS